MGSSVFLPYIYLYSIVFVTFFIYGIFRVFFFLKGKKETSETRGNVQKRQRRRNELLLREDRKPYLEKIVYRNHEKKRKERNNNKHQQSRYKEKLKTVDIILYVIVSLLVFLFIATRHISVGTDTQAYVDFFNHSRYWYQGYKTDFLFEQLGRFLKLFSNTSEYFIFATSLLCYGGLFFVILKESRCRVFSLLLFMIMGTSSIFFFLYLSMIRQGIAMSYFFLSVYFLYQKRLFIYHRILLFMIFYIASILTHASCLFTLPFIVVVSLKPVASKVFWLVLILVTYLMAANNVSIVQSLLGYAFDVIDVGKYENYADIAFGEIEAKGWLNMNVLPFIVLALVFLFVCSKRELKDWKMQFVLFSVVLNNVFFDNLMWSRLILYFSIFMVIVFPNALRHKGFWLQLSTYFLVFVYFMYKTMTQFIANAAIDATGNIIVPYKSWLFVI